jgi:hypothetical protein
VQGVLPTALRELQDLACLHRSARSGWSSSCAGRCAPRAWPSVRRRAQLRMGPRVVGLLWELTMAPGAPPEVARGSQLVGALMAYACRGADGIALVWDYLGRCVAQARRPAWPATP